MLYCSIRSLIYNNRSMFHSKIATIDDKDATKCIALSEGLKAKVARITYLIGRYDN